MFTGKDKRMAQIIASRRSRGYLDRTGARLVDSHFDCFNSAIDMAEEKNKEMAKARGELLGRVYDWLEAHVEDYSATSFHKEGFLRDFFHSI